MTGHWGDTRSTDSAIGTNVATDVKKAAVRRRILFISDKVIVTNFQNEVMVPKTVERHLPIYTDKNLDSRIKQSQKLNLNVPSWRCGWPFMKPATMLLEYLCIEWNTVGMCREIKWLSNIILLDLCWLWIHLNWTATHVRTCTKIPLPCLRWCTSIVYI